MDASNSALLSVTLGELRNSQLPEDRDVADLAVQTMDSLLENLKPILVYVTAPQVFYADSASDCRRGAVPKTAPGAKAAKVYHNPGLSDFALFIQHDGSFLRAEMCCKNNLSHCHRIAPFTSNEPEWSLFPIDAVMEGIRDLIASAEDKKREHLQVVAKRRQMLDSIMQVVKNG